MKRILTAALLIALLLLTASCSTPGTNQTEPETELSAELYTASETDAAGFAKSAPASGTEAVPVTPTPAPTPMYPSGYEDAEQCIGQPLEALYEAVGEPESYQYASSCEEENAEDGMLFYDGFYVWTLKTESEEIVRAVYLDD